MRISDWSSDVWRFRSKLRAGRKPCVKPAAMPEDIDLREIDHEANLIVLRRSTTKGPLPDRLDLIPAKPIGNATLRAAVAAVTYAIIDNPGAAKAIEQLLVRAAPTFRDGPRPDGIIDPKGDLPAQTSAAIAAMDQTTRSEEHTS